MRYTEIMESQSSTLKAYELISGYVTHGSMSAGDEFDGDFDTLMRILPRPRRPMRLYRVLRLDSPHIAQIDKGGLRLSERRYSSWTKSKDSLDRLLYDRQRDGSKLVIIQAMIAGNNIVVDVAAFYRQNYFTSGDIPEWSRYVRPEQEVIVRHDGPWLITPEMVVEIVEPKTSSDRTPRVGEWFMASDGTKERIAVVDLENSSDGVYRITTESGDPVFLRLNRQGKWIEIEH